MEEAKKKFTTNAEEIMKAGADAITYMELKRPHILLIDDELTDLVAILAAIWERRKEGKD